MGLVITEIRVRARISQGELAHMLGYNISYVGMIERGQKSMTIGTLDALAGFFSTTPSRLLARAERRRLKAKRG